jgi:hypothetical protein
LGTVINDATGTNAVAVQGYAIAIVQNAQVWGANFLASSTSGTTGATITGIEVDLNNNDAGDSVAGVSVGGPGTNASLTRAFIVSGKATPCQYGFNTQDGAAELGLALGCSSSANNVSSQTIQLASRDSSGNAHFGYITTNPNGAFHFQPDVVNNSNISLLMNLDYHNGHRWRLRLYRPQRPWD